MLPLVSVCIPTYNSELYLADMLESIVAQTYKNIEVIISDNCSTDHTLEIAEKYSKEYNFTLYKQDHNLGAGGNFNFIIEHANGEFVAIYHADDIYENTIIEESVNILLSNPEVGMVTTMGYEINNFAKIKKEYKAHNNVLSLLNKAIDFENLFLGMLTNDKSHIFVLTPSVMARKIAYSKCGLFDSANYKSACDYEMWLRIALNKFKVYIIDEPLFKYRIHENQGSQKEIRDNLTVQDIVLVYKEYMRFSKHKIKIIIKILEYYLSFYIKKYLK